MKSVVAKRGQTIIPKTIRLRHGIQAGDRLAWIDDGKTLRVVVLPADPIKALHGRAKGERLMEKLLASRAEDRQREQSG